MAETPIDPRTHQRYLDYRDRHAYFGHDKPLMAIAAFLPLDEEQLALDEKGESRDDEEEARFNELCQILYRD